MKIVDAEKDEKIMSRVEAEEYLEHLINNKATNYLYIVKYKGEMISISGKYYKFSWKKIEYLKRALVQKFGKELSNALVKDKVIEIYKVVV